jgi:hypothetical protein
LLVGRYILIYMLDITMHSPPKEAIPVFGASCSTGGSLRGHSIGNTFNIADVGQVWGDINSLDGEGLPVYIRPQPCSH